MRLEKISHTSKCEWNPLYGLKHRSTKILALRLKYHTSLILIHWYRILQFILFYLLIISNELSYINANYLNRVEKKSCNCMCSIQSKIVITYWLALYKTYSMGYDMFILSGKPTIPMSLIYFHPECSEMSDEIS